MNENQSCKTYFLSKAEICWTGFRRILEHYAKLRKSSSSKKQALQEGLRNQKFLHKEKEINSFEKHTRDIHKKSNAT